VNIPWTDYRTRSVEPTVATGDLFAFGGKSAVASVVQGLCGGPVDHVAPVLRTRAQDELFVVWIIEAVIPEVRAVPLRHRLAAYDGDVWWLPLGPDQQKRCDYRRMTAYMLGSIGRRYDVWQAARVGLHLPNTECEEAYFCSELAGFIYEAGGLLSHKINPSNTDPVEICKWGLWGADYHYVQGNDPRELPGFNTVPVGR